MNANIMKMHMFCKRRIDLSLIFKHFKRCLKSFTNKNHALSKNIFARIQTSNKREHLKMKCNYIVHCKYVH